MTNSQNDETLITLLNKGDNKVLSLVYKKYWETMYLAAYNMVKNKEISEDIVQDIFVNLWHKRDQITIKTSLKSYLYTSTIYKVYDYFKKNKHIIKLELFENFDKKIQSSNPETILMHGELIKHIDSVIENLPEKCKLVFKLSREDQLSNREIAKKLNISPRTVENHISKALKYLRASLNVSLSLEFITFILQNKN
ncbi:RNA polymerase sigma-70 factor [Flavivirga amylovorans]|uniref:RNA polymerase sigma-70 factor n=1 Tax=Flavivirga amylovorans TaxID=870486 RepID=A0ABT8WZF5_9FLAO|nr:RNA polymerase sigma-70 factor [Flavivirga amylovorans]MDO5987063.1 RNA polymerase sigma-70 factor [Flavivirga amylovorans]